ncbi:MAG: radical SAM protein [Phycisphaerae bacterium]
MQAVHPSKGGRPRMTRADFAQSPMVVFYELTRACDLACVHCRANAQTGRDPAELSTEQAKRLVRQLAAFPKPPLLVLTGGDPLKREDVHEIIAAAREAGLQVALTPSATPLVTRAAIERVRDAGLHRLAVSLDGADAATHDGFRRVAGSFARTLEILRDAQACGLPVQVNTTIARHNVEQIDALAELLAPLGIVLWSAFFLVPTGRASAEQRISPETYEEVFAKLLGHVRRQPYAIKTTEAPHFRRYVLQQVKGGIGAAPSGVPMAGTNDGRGVMFISHTGEVCPSGFLPIACGQFPLDSVVRVYQESALFRALREPERVSGKCGVCEFREICGGSRARAYGLTGDPLASDPDCVYVPVRWKKEAAECVA